MTTRYPIRAVARLTGLSIDTLRAWERRYGVVNPERDSRGRVYNEAQIEHLRRLRTAVEQGHSIGRVAELSSGDLARLLEHPVLRAAEPASLSASSDDLVATVFESLDAFDATSAESSLSRFAALLEPRRFVYEIVLPLMREVGERWHAGRYSVAQEHLASSIVRNQLGALLNLRTPPGAGRPILIASPTGELHEFGILAGAMLIASVGRPLIYLGPNLPATDAIESAHRSNAHAVLLGISNPEPDQAALDEVVIVAKGLQRDIELWIGGPIPPESAGGIDRTNLHLLPDFDALERRLAT